MSYFDFVDLIGLFVFLAIIMVISILFFILCFLLFCCKVVTNPTCNACLENLQNNISDLQNDVEWAKNSTHIRIFGKWQIPKYISENIWLYEIKSIIHRRGLEFINSKMKITISQLKEYQNPEDQRLLTTPGINMMHNKK